MGSRQHSLATALSLLTRRTPPSRLSKLPWQPPWRRKRESRRTRQRKARKRWKKESLEELHNNNRLQKETENNIEKYKQQQSDIYGFCADPDQPAWKNIESYILQMPPYLYKSKIANMSCHNYCEPKSTMPSGVESLLGMGLKYCIKVPRPTNKLPTTFDRFREDVR